jgi:hypothetical protein
VNEREVIETRGDYRAVIIRDDYPDPPDWGSQAGVIRFAYEYGRTEVDSMTPAAEEYGLAASRFIDHYGMSDGMAVFERYLRIFHGATDVRSVTSSWDRSYVVYMVFATSEMLEEWGCSPEYAPTAAEGTADEWQAYIDGDVYGIAVEKHVAYATTYSDGRETVTGTVWDPIVDTEVWGHYGEEYARSEALLALDDYATKEVAE